jgi:outer membrane protein with beta-barrel domain
MKKPMRYVLLLAASVACLAAPAAATDFGIGAAYWNTKDADEGLGVGTKLGFGLFEVRATYFSDVTADTSPERFDFEVKALPLEAGLAFHFAEGAAFSPYAGGGAGYYLLDTTEGDIDDEVGWYAVLGGDFGRTDSGLGFNVEAIYRGIEATVTEDSDGFPDDIHDDVNIDLSGLGLNAGVVWRF